MTSNTAGVFDRLVAGTFVGTLLLLLAIASVASSIPALRATRVDPMTALRWE